jgi:vacuolar-type H+-ATPase subunit H
MLTVPSAGDELSGEVAFLFGDLEEIEARRDALVAAARGEAADSAEAARQEGGRLLAQAHEEGERRAAMLLDERRAHAEERGRAVRANAAREATRIRARGRQRTPDLVEEIVRRLLEEAP